MKQQIYWDNAATTFPKPLAVREAMQNALSWYGANPGRGGHAMASRTSEELYRCRKTAADFFGCTSPERVVFTLNCTTAINMVVKGVLQNGGHALISDLEHNAVVRPLHALSPLSYKIVQTHPRNPAQTVENFRRAITRDTRLIVCTHASNVWGYIQPIRELGVLAAQYGIPFLVDAAQSAGILPIDMEKDHIDFLCVAGHKGLYGPMGTGMLITSARFSLPSYTQGGTGSRSMSPSQPEDWPDHMESGTPNTAGICGLRAGMDWVKRMGVSRIHHYEIACVQKVYRCLETERRVQLYTTYPTVDMYAPVLTFNYEGIPSETAAAWLDEAGLAVRAGLHCAPLAHRKAGTESHGAVRLAPSFFTSAEEVEKVCKILLQTAQKSLQ